MRLGVLDVGSNTVHFLVVDAHQGARPLPVFSHKAELHLGDHLEDGNRLSASVTRQLRAFVEEALQIAEDKGVEELLAFATSAVRDAANGDEVLRAVRDSSGVAIQVLPGEEEARLTFLAARRWFGWSSGRLLMLDIGGGSLELAAGIDEEPDVAISLPLGAARLTRDWLTGNPPAPEQVRQLRKHVRAEIARRAAEVARPGQHDRAVATSKTFRQLARISGAAPALGQPRRLHRSRQTTGGHVRGPARDVARGIPGARSPACRRRAGGRRRDGPARHTRTGDLPLGAA